jgi:sugar/nucleoside kinase (ribokinase family)
MSTPFNIFVIGTVSLDTLHLTNGQTIHTAGGAGLYTALAAHCAGARVGLFAPRPEPMPELLRPVADRLAWVGPVIALDDLPRLEIQHHGGGRATLLAASWGVESLLTPEVMPPEVAQARFVHIAALSSAQWQMEFLQSIKREGAKAPGRKVANISVGTYARLVYGDTVGVCRLFDQADIFFCNENEAIGLFGGVDRARTRPGTRLFITLGANGALVIEGEQVTHVPGQPAVEVDPTGAGDTFGGAVLAGLARGESAVVAARQAVVLAARTISAVGPEALLTDKLEPV